MRWDHRKKILCLFTGVIFLLLSTGWAIGQGPASKVAFPKLLTIGTHPVGTNVNAIATGMATVLNKHLPTVVKIMPTTGPVEWLPMVTTGEVDMGVLTLWDSKMGRLGRADYKDATAGKGAPIYLLCPGTSNLTSPIVSESSGIRKGADFKGKRCIITFTGSGGVTAQASGGLANYGLKTSDIKPMSATSIDAAIRLVGEGRADGALTAAVGMPVVTEVNIEKGIRFISLDPSAEAVKRMHEFMPVPLVQVTPGPNRVGVREPIHMMSLSFYFVGSEKLSDDVAYAIIKAIWEYNEELFPIHPRLKDWTKDKFVDPRAWIPYHPGAIKFYKEIGAWGAEMDNVQKKLLGEK